jgi:hypothetical protein
MSDVETAWGNGAVRPRFWHPALTLFLRVPMRRNAVVARCAAVCCVLALLSPSIGRGQEDFERKIAPLLAKHCVGCHNESESSGGLNLTTAATVLAGGESGPAVVAGNLDESWLVQRIIAGEMPPPGKGAPVSEAEQTAIVEWVTAGATWPAERVVSPYEVTTDRRAGFDWWSLQPVVRPEVPANDAANPIDAFLKAKLAEAGLSFSPPADRASFIRRATFDLLGLPPTPEEIQAFVADPAPDAYEQLVDRLLASPRYGERWGRHWLDVVRFGETNGYETNTPRANAWPYRDYVIDAFNNDLPFDRFVREQLAGDQLYADVATGFIVGGTHDIVGIAEPVGSLQQRMNDLDDFVATTGTAFLGLTTGCARCHDHKFDPITQRDYYALQAVFAGVMHGERRIAPPDHPERLAREPEIRRQLAEIERELVSLEPLANPHPEAAPQRRQVEPRKNIDRFAPTLAKYVRFTVLSTNQSEPCIDELEVFTAEETPRNVALASAGATVAASGVYANGSEPIHQISHVNDGQYGNGRSWISESNGQGWVQIELPQAEMIERLEWARDREGVFADRVATNYRIEVAAEPGQWVLVAASNDRIPYGEKAPEVAPGASDAARYQELLAKRDALTAELPEQGGMSVYCGTFQQPGPTHRLHRGDPQQPKEVVSASGIGALGKKWELPTDAPEAERRLALANWIASAENPLTARVIVNRVWHYHFRTGLVDSPSNFGFNGGQPSHPELLDWLAADLIDGGWRLKRLHRMIMLSDAYRQSSDSSADGLAKDASDRLLWRFPPHRLEAEPLRDAILLTSGKLDLKMGGPGYDAFQPNDNYVHVYIPRETFGPAEWRRMIYQSKPRMVQDNTFGVFDCPDAASVVPRRNVSTTALQALSLLNSPFMMQQAGFFAERLQAEAGDDAAAQVERGFWLAFGRAPSEEEKTAAVALVNEHGLLHFCRALFNADEFVYVR